MNMPSIGKLLLRLGIGGLLLFHGIDKVTHGVEYIGGLISLYNLPAQLAYAVYIGEIIAPIFLILGWKSRWWATTIVINMAVAIYLVHFKTIFTLGAHGALSIETPLLYLMGALAIIFLGSGRYAISAD